jgi:hypothetical protein
MKRKWFLLILLTKVALLVFSQSNNYAGGNGTIIEIKTDGNITWILRKHLQRIQIGNMASDYSLIIYDKPSLENRKVIGELKIDDYIDVSQIAEVISADNSYFLANVITDNNSCYADLT